MTPLEMDLTGADILRPSGERSRTPLSVANGQIVSDPVGRQVDLSGYLVLPGIIDLHGDGFERHLAPRRGAMKQMGEGVIATEAELAANGITTAVLAQFHSWEGGLRSPEYASQVFDAISAVRKDVVTDLIGQLRFETHLLEEYSNLPQRIGEWGLSYVVFNDHLPHDRLAQGRKPPRLTGQALKAGRNPDDHFEMLLALHRRSEEVPAALDALCEVLTAQGVRIGSHDDQTAEDISTWRARGATISEFPETAEAAETARAQGNHVVLGAPNVVRGGSHKGNISAVELIAMGLCDAIASDYHYPSPRRAALMLVKTGMCDMAQAWSLVSTGPARVLGLKDRGQLTPGLRADMVILEADTHRVAATMAAGRFSYVSGDVAARFFG